MGGADNSRDRDPYACVEGREESHGVIGEALKRYLVEFFSKPGYSGGWYARGCALFIGHELLDEWKKDAFGPRDDCNGRLMWRFRFGNETAIVEIIGRQLSGDQVYVFEYRGGYASWLQTARDADAEAKGV